MSSAASRRTIPAVILAAGKGTRMRRDQGDPKAVVRVGGRPMVARVLDAVRGAGLHRAIAVVGHRCYDVRAAIGDGVEYVVQEEQLGTGHAARCAQVALEGYSGPVIIAYADIPLLIQDDISRLLDHHILSGSAATLLTAVLDQAGSLGRVVRSPDSGVQAIVEARDATEGQLGIKEINVGLYCFEAPRIFQVLSELTRENAQSQYHLTDAIGILARRGLLVDAVALDVIEDKPPTSSSHALAMIGGRMQVVTLLSDGTYAIVEDEERFNASLHFMIAGVVSGMAAAVEELEWLVNREPTTEAELQAFFERYPQFLLGVDYGRLHAQLVLQRAERGPLIPDFLLEPVGSPLACDVIDLKRPQERIITRNGGRAVFAKSVLRAAAQLREYHDYFDDDQHRGCVLSRYGISAYRPNTAVIIGREPVNEDPYVMQDVKRDIAGMKVLTYDDIIRRGRRLLDLLT